MMLFTLTLCIVLARHHYMRRQEAKADYRPARRYTFEFKAAGYIVWTGP
jgi:hypothetical protein